MICDCKEGHKDQLVKFPVNSVVSLKVQISQVMTAGIFGRVLAHCNDGRAMMEFFNLGLTEVHTFHFPDDYVEVKNDQK